MTVNGSHCIGVEMLNLIALTPLVRAVRTVMSVEARRREVGRGIFVMVIVLVSDVRSCRRLNLNLTNCRADFEIHLVVDLLTSIDNPYRPDLMISALSGLSASIDVATRSFRRR